MNEIVRKIVEIVGIAFTWFLGKLDAIFAGFLEILGAIGGIALITWAVKKFWMEKIKHGYEILRIKVKEQYERDRLTITHRQKMVETMVVQFHEFTKTYYMQIIAAIGRFVLGLEREEARGAFRSLAEYLSAQRKLRSAIHGYFLRDVVGERVVAYLEYWFIHEYLGNMASSGFLKVKEGEGELLAKTWQDDMTMDEFMAKIELDQKLNEIYNRFKDWAQNKEKKREVVLMADTLEQVLKLEVNLGYEGWYEKIPSHFREENLAFLKSKLDMLVDKNVMRPDEAGSFFERTKKFRVKEGPPKTA